MEHTYITVSDIVNIFTWANLMDFAHAVAKFGFYVVAAFIFTWIFLFVMSLILVLLFD